MVLGSLVIDLTDTESFGPLCTTDVFPFRLALGESRTSDEYKSYGAKEKERNRKMEMDKSIERQA